MRLGLIINLLFISLIGKTQTELSIVYQNYQNSETGWQKKLFVTVYFKDSLVYGVATKKRKEPEIVGNRHEPHAYFINYKKDEAIFQAIPQQLPRYRIKDSTRKFEWSVLNEEKEILGIKCIKAITNYEGQTITVWFAPSIAVGIGPTMLNGTPGLILEANFQHPLTVYRAIDIKYSSPTILEPSKGILISPSDYKEALRKRDAR